MRIVIAIAGWFAFSGLCALWWEKWERGLRERTAAMPDKPGGSL